MDGGTRNPSILILDTNAHGTSLLHYFPGICTDWNPIRGADFFLRNSRCGAERISVLAKPTDYYGADFPPRQWHGSERSGLSVLICCHGLERICPRLSRSGSDRISARGKCHGLPRSGYPPSKKSRIFAERISVKRIFHGADYLTPSNKPHTVRFIHGAPEQQSVEYKRLSADSRRISADKYHERRQQRNNDKQYERVVVQVQRMASRLSRWKKHDTRICTAVWENGNSAGIFQISDSGDAFTWHCVFWPFFLTGLSNLR